MNSISVSYGDMLSLVNSVSVSYGVPLSLVNSVSCIFIKEPASREGFMVQNLPQYFVSIFACHHTQQGILVNNLV